ncbi:MAG: dynamin family protein [Desulfomonilaceae bacterium]|nr:dynamin family protein [Desulfomonilaceae bacterium]
MRKALRHQAQEIYNFVQAGSESHVLLSDLGEVIQDLEDNTFKIGLFGVTAAGKSTLTNALLRDSILREGMGETTRTLTRICASDENHPHGTVVIRYKTLQSIHQELDEHLKVSGFGFKEGLRINLADPAFRADLRAILRNNRDCDSEIDITCRYIRHLLNGWDKSETHLGSELTLSIEESDELVHGHEDVATYISERIIYHDNEITRDGFTFFDAPGIGSSYARHTQEAVSLARRVDAAVLVTKVDYKFMPPDRRFVRDALDVQRMQDRHNLVFALNQISRINPLQSNPPRPPDQFDACVAEEVDRLRERLAEVGIDDTTLYPVDAAAGRWTRCHLADPGDAATEYNFRHYAFVHCKDDPQANLKTSGLADFEEGLIKHLTSIRYYSFLANRLDRLKTANGSYQNECSLALSDLTRTLEALEKKLAEHQSHSDKVNKLLNEYLDYTMQAKIDEQYKDLPKSVADTVDEAFEILVKTFSKNMKKVEIYPDRYWAWVVDESREEVYKKIKQIRDKYENRYRTIRDEAIRETIPKILRDYPEIDWKLTQKDFTFAERTAIQSFSKIKLDWWQQAKAFMFSGLRSSAERYKSLAIGYLNENFQGLFREGFAKDIRGWVDADKRQFSDQVRTKFVALDKQVKDRIQHSIKLTQATAGQKEAADERLQSFITKCEVVGESLKELEMEIEKARPADAASAGRNHDQGLS